MSKVDLSDRVKIVRNRLEIRLKDDIFTISIDAKIGCKAVLVVNKCNEDNGSNRIYISPKYSNEIEIS